MKDQLLRSAVMVCYLALITSIYSFRSVAQQKVQEIKFSTTSYKEVLAAAKASHKKVFVDAFATWCAPCKELQQRTFRDPEAAAYFNKHFINFSIDVEKGEGVELASTWQVDGLPALLIVDENGRVLANHTGFVDGKGLVEFAGEAAANTRSKRSNPASNRGHERNPWYSNTDTTKLYVSNAAWEKVLAPDLYAVAREKDTERPFSGRYWKSTTRGTYYCAVCGNLLFRSDAKFASSCGWPSFYEPSRANALRYQADDSFGTHRIEVLCGRCDSHLGHIFDDGPPPTHKRFCMNSISLDFAPDKK